MAYKYRDGQREEQSRVQRNVILGGLPGAHSMLLCAEGAEREGLGECYGAIESTESTDRSD